jgi:hypothetical protein
MLPALAIFPAKIDDCENSGDNAIVGYGLIRPQGASILRGNSCFLSQFDHRLFNRLSQSSVSVFRKIVTKRTTEESFRKDLHATYGSVWIAYGY